MFRKIIIALAVCLLTLSCKLSKDDGGILPDSGDNEFLPDVEGPEKPKKPSSNGADENDLGGDQGDQEGDGGNEDLDEDEGEEIDLAGYVTGTGANWESECIKIDNDLYYKETFRWEPTSIKISTSFFEIEGCLKYLYEKIERSKPIKILLFKKSLS